jgi:hypothetical protein
MRTTTVLGRLRLGLLAAIVAVGLLAGFAGGATAANYTALGDSYAAARLPQIEQQLRPPGGTRDRAQPA